MTCIDNQIGMNMEDIFKNITITGISIVCMLWIFCYLTSEHKFSQRGYVVFGVSLVASIVSVFIGFIGWVWS